MIDILEGIAYFCMDFGLWFTIISTITWAMSLNCIVRNCAYFGAWFTAISTATFVMLKLNKK